MKELVQATKTRIAAFPRLKLIAWTVGILFIIIIALWAFFTLKGKITEKLERRKVSYVEGGGAVADDFNAGTYADEMFDVMDGVFTLANTKLQAACDLMKLNDNEIIAVHNYWNEHLYDRNSETLYKMMKAEWNTPDFTTGTNCWTALLARLSRLNLISK